MLPLGVVIPTKNSMPYLPRHVEGLRPWLDLAAEVVVVDSESCDGTVDYLRANLAHPGLRFTSHPPGLYASWNHGIAQIRSRYAYLATVGDTITREGIGKLVESAESLGCDVVISPPALGDATGRALPDPEWPIQEVIAALNVQEPRRLRPREAVVFAAVHATDALTGSSASDVFRTETLQRHPFPTDFGTSGDAAWGWLHAGEVWWGVVPDRLSTFLVHPTNASNSERQSFRTAQRPDAVLRVAMERWRRDGAIAEQDLPGAVWEELLGWLSSYFDAKSTFDDDRRGAVPWLLRPAAWRNRWRREHAVRQLHRLKARLLYRTGE